MASPGDHHESREGALAGARMPEALRAPTGPISVEGLDELGKHLARLKALHPDLQVAFRASDLKTMTHEERVLLLGDVNEALGISGGSSAER